MKTPRNLAIDPGLFAADRDPVWLIDAPQLAELLGISQRTLWRFRSAGKLPPALKLGGCVRWRLAEVRQWIAAGCPRLDQ